MDDGRRMPKELEDEVPGLQPDHRPRIAYILIWKHIQKLKEQIKKLEEQLHGS